MVQFPVNDYLKLLIAGRLTYDIPGTGIEFAVAFIDSAGPANDFIFFLQ
jgi:hypothetical protein